MSHRRGYALPMKSKSQGPDHAGNRVAKARRRRFNHAQTQTLIESGDLPAVWKERDPICRAVEDLFRSYARRDQGRRLQDEYATFEDCSAATRIPEAALAQAAARGCEAVAGGRVRLMPFLRWHFEHDPLSALPTLAERLEHGRLQNALLRLQLGCARGRYIPLRHLRRLFDEVRESVRRVFALRREAAAGFPGHSEEAIAQRLSLDAEALEAQARMVDEAVRFWGRQARESKRAKQRP